MSSSPVINNIMLDLETMGTDSDAAIIAIGAVRFDTSVTDSFYRVVDLQSSLDVGLTMSADSILWWLKQEDKARQAITVEGVALRSALLDFKKWAGEDALIWGNGATFDNVILANAYNKSAIECPWHYSANRCYRTLKSFYPDVAFQHVGVAHNALDDAQSQAVHLLKIFKCI